MEEPSAVAEAMADRQGGHSRAASPAYAKATAWQAGGRREKLKLGEKPVIANQAFGVVNQYKALWRKNLDFTAGYAGLRRGRTLIWGKPFVIPGEAGPRMFESGDPESRFRIGSCKGGQS